MTLKEMICLNIRIKKNDNVNGKRLEKVIIDFLMKSNVLGAIVWLGVDGFGRRGKSTVHLEGRIFTSSSIVSIIIGWFIINPYNNRGCLKLSPLYI